MRILLISTVVLLVGVLAGLPWPVVGLPLVLRQLRRELADFSAACRGETPELRAALLAESVREVR